MCIRPPILATILAALMAVQSEAAFGEAGPAPQPPAAKSPGQAEPAVTADPAVTPPPAPAIDPASARRSMDEYISRLSKAIMKSWLPPSVRQESKTVVSFRVHRDGSISDIAVSASCGDKVADGKAAAIIQGLSPAEALPATAGDSIVIDFKFELNAPSPADAEAGENLSIRRKAWQETPESARSNYEYGRALRFAGALTAAVERLQEAVKLGYDGSAPLTELAAAYSKLGKHKEAEAMLRAVIEKEPNLDAAHKQLADLYYEEGRWAEAKGSYETFRRLHPAGPLSSLAETRIETCSQRLSGVTESDE